MSINRRMRRQMVKGVANYDRQKDLAEECIIHGREIGRKEAADQTFEHIMTMTCFALHDKFGFGHDRIERLLDAMKIYALCLYEHEVTLDEMKECLKNECGIDIEDLKNQEVDADEGKRISPDKEMFKNDN